MANAETDKAVAAVFGVPFETLSTWKKRNKIPYEQLCDFAERSGASLDYLLLGKKPRIDQTIFREVQRALKSEYSVYRDLSSMELGDVTAIYYNQYADIEDPERRKQTILRTLLFADQGATKHYKQMVASPEFLAIPNAQDLLQKFRETNEKRAKEIQALLDDDEKFRAAINKIWGQFNAPEPSILLEPVVPRQTTEQDKRASRAISRKGGKKKK